MTVIEGLIYMDNLISLLVKIMWTKKLFFVKQMATTQKLFAVKDKKCNLV